MQLVTVRLNYIKLHSIGFAHQILQVRKALFATVGTMTDNELG